MRKERIQYILPESVVGDVNLLPEVNGTPQNLKKNNEAITLGTLGNEAWLVTGSLYPTAPEEGSSTNILVWPNKWDSHIPLSEISLSDLVAANIYNTKLLKLIPGSVVTYSISSDSRGITGETRKALGSSIRTFHFHTYVDVEGSLINTSDEGTYKSLREPFSNELAQITQKYFQENMNIPSEVELVDQKDIAATIFPYANRGGVVFLLD